MKNSVLVTFLALPVLALGRPLPAVAQEPTLEQQSAAAGVRFAQDDPGGSAPAQPVAAGEAAQKPAEAPLGRPNLAASAKTPTAEVPPPSPAADEGKVDNFQKAGFLFYSGMALTVGGFLLMQPGLVKAGIVALAGGMVVIGMRD